MQIEEHPAEEEFIRQRADIKSHDGNLALVQSFTIIGPSANVKVRLQMCVNMLQGTGLPIPTILLRRYTEGKIVDNSARYELNAA
jgi:hypothetical protein